VTASKSAKRARIIAKLGPSSHSANPYAGYVWGVGSVAACAGFSGLVVRYLQLSDLVMINLLPVIGVSIQFGIGPSVITAALSSLCFDFFFIPPIYSFAPSDLKSAITLVVMVVVAGVINGLAEVARRQHSAARTRELALETERLRNSLLSAVSHDLRTPLAAIFGAGTELLQDGRNLAENERNELVSAIVEEAARLDQLVTNLLDVAKLDGGRIQIKKRLEPLDEVVEAALERLRGRLGGRPVRSHVPQEIPMVPMDAFLMQQVLVNRAPLHSGRVAYRGGGDVRKQRRDRRGTRQRARDPRGGGGTAVRALLQEQRAFLARRRRRARAFNLPGHRAGPRRQNLDA
jgi:K+-sensing histidine kinase KdpD